MSTTVIVGNRITIHPALLSRDWNVYMDGERVERVQAVLVAPDPRLRAQHLIRIVKTRTHEPPSEVVDEFRRHGWTVEINDATTGQVHSLGPTQPPAS